MIYSEARRRGASEVEAADYAERYVFNYSDLPRTARIIRDSPVGIPFISYAYKAVPMVASTFAAAPHRMLPIYGLLLGANALAYSMLAGDADEDEERRDLPDYMKGLTAVGTPKVLRVPFNDVNGNPVFFDVSRRLPLGDLFDSQNQMGGMPLLAPFTPSNPVLNTIIAMTANKDPFTGRDVVPSFESPEQAAKLRAQWLTMQILPAAPQVPFSWSWDKAMNAVASATESEIDLGVRQYPGTTTAGDKIDPRLVAADITGLAKLRAPNLDVEASRREGRLAVEVREINAAIRRVARSKAMSESAKERETTRLIEQRQRIIDEARQ
jgi:hypothetical protein